MKAYPLHKILEFLLKNYFVIKPNNSIVKKIAMASDHKIKLFYLTQGQ